jgi:inosine-uridine nucleoside N-ribohydrolase
MELPFSDPAALKSRLAHPESRVSLVLDTDTYNEVDDQFALAYALRSPGAMDLEAIYAAPFHNDRSTGPGDGMEKSYMEILNVLGLMDEPVGNRVHRGATAYLSASDVPVESDAARDLVARAMARSPEDPPLYVAAIAAITNVASAILMEPRIRERIVVLWLGGHALDCAATDEFNLRQDVLATRLVFDCGVPLVWFPCAGMASHLATSVAELDRDLAGRSAIGDYLAGIVRGYGNDHFAWTKVIWDIAPIGWLIDQDWAPSRLIPSPILDGNGRAWRTDDARHPIREVVHMHRDGVFRDLFLKLGR